MTRFALLMAASILAGSALAQNRVIDEKWDVRNGPARRMQLQWFAGESVELNLEPTYGRDAADLDGSTIVWTVADFDAPTNVYVQATGTVASAIATVELTHEQANLPEGTYSGWVSAESSNQVSILAYQTIKVTWSPSSGSWAVVEGSPLFASAVLVAAISNDLAQAIALKADTSALSTTSNTLAQAVALKASTSALSTTSNTLAQSIALKASTSALSTTSNTLAQAVALKADAATAATTSALSTTSNALAQAIADVDVGNGNTTNLTITAGTTITLVFSNGLYYGILPSGDLVDISYFLPEYAVSEPTTNYPGWFVDYGFVPSTTNVSALAPYVNEWIRQGGPDSTIPLTAENLASSNALFIVYDGSEYVRADLKILDDRQVAITLPSTLTTNEFYLVWPFNSEGFGEPVAINRAEAWYANPARCWSNSFFNIYGENLVLGDASTGTAYCVETGEWLDSTTNCNPYRLEFETPSSWTNGTYTIIPHNGHGGKYGWSAKSITITKVYRPDWTTGTVWNVTEHGVVGDGSTDNTTAMNAIVSGASDGDSIYAPSGTYLFGSVPTYYSTGKQLRIYGDGETTIFTTHSNMVATTNNYLAKFGGSRVENIYFNQGTNYSYGYRGIWVDGNDTEFVNCRFDSTVPYGANGTSFFDPFYGTRDGTRYYDCEFHMAHSLYGGQNNYLQGCTFVGYMGIETPIYTRETRGYVVIDCDYGPADFTDTTITNSLEGRFIVGGGNEFHEYFEGNSGTNVNPGVSTDQNSGEIFLWEGCGAKYWTTNIGIVNASSLTWPALTSVASCQYLKFAIIDGKGLGQTRIITNSTTSGSVLLDEPLRTLPDSNSVCVIVDAPYKVIMYDNSFGANPVNIDPLRATACQPYSYYGAASRMIHDGNQYWNTTTAYRQWLRRTSAIGVVPYLGPQFFNLTKNNVLHGMRAGVEFISSYSSTELTDFGDVGAGNVFSGNQFFDIQGSAILVRIAKGSTRLGLTVFENNYFDSTFGYISTDLGSFKNFFLRNNTFSTISKWRDQPLGDWRFESNTFSSAGFSGIDRKKPLVSKAIRVGEDGGTLDLFNQGSTNVVLSISDDAAWLGIASSVDIPAQSSTNIPFTVSATTEGSVANIDVVGQEYSATNTYLYLNGTSSYFSPAYTNGPNTKLELLIRLRTAEINSGDMVFGNNGFNARSFNTNYYRITNGEGGSYDMSSSSHYQPGTWEFFTIDCPNGIWTIGDAFVKQGTNYSTGNITIGCKNTLGDYAPIDFSFVNIYEGTNLVRSYYAEDAYGTTLPDRTGNHDATLVNCTITNEVVSYPATTNTFTVIYGTELGVE